MYRNIALTKMKEEFAYKHRSIISFASSILAVFILWFVWTAIFQSSPETVIGGFTIDTMITYVIIAVVMRSILFSYIENNIEFDVRTGYISIQIVRPYIYPIYYFFIAIGNVLYRLIINAIPILFIGFFVLNISLPLNPILFFISLGLGFIVNFLLILLTGLWAFWSMGSIWGIKYTRQVVSEVVSGSIIPLTMFPLWLANIAELLPFKAVYYTPISIYVGHITGEQIIYAMLQQIFWIGVLFAFAYFIWKKSENKVISQGG